MTEWFRKGVGQELLESLEHPGMGLLVFDKAAPDWVRLPKEFGGEQIRVEGSGEGFCPKCLRSEVPFFTLAGGFSVHECTGCGFVWKRPTEEEAYGAS